MKNNSSKGPHPLSLKATAYVTKRVLVRATRTAGRKASRKAMETAGFLIQAHNGWVVRINPDGSEIKLKELTAVTLPKTIHLD